MPVLTTLTGRIREGVYELQQLQDKKTAFERALEAPRKELGKMPGGRKRFAQVDKHFDAASTSMDKAIDSYRDMVKNSVRSHFAKHGIEPGAVVELTYPVYQFSLDDELEASERLLRTETVTLKVEAFAIRRARSRTDVGLDIVGYPKKGRRFANDFDNFRLEPGYEFKVIQPAA